MTPMTRARETRITDFEQLNQVIYSRITVNTLVMTENELMEHRHLETCQTTNNQQKARM